MLFGSLDSAVKRNQSINQSINQSAWTCYGAPHPKLWRARNTVKIQQHNSKEQRKTTPAKTTALQPHTAHLNYEIIYCYIVYMAASCGSWIMAALNISVLHGESKDLSLAFFRLIYSTILVQSIYRYFLTLCLCSWKYTNVLLDSSSSACFLLRHSCVTWC